MINLTATPANGSLWRRLCLLTLIATAPAACHDNPVATLYPDSAAPTLSASTGGEVAKTSWDAQADFSLDFNPNGAWSAGVTGTLGGTPSLYTNKDRTITWGDDPLYGWTVNDWTNDPYFATNPQSREIGGMAPGQIALHPGQPGSGLAFSVLRWTAPYSGTFAVTAQFFVGHSGPNGAGDTEAYVLRNGSPEAPLGTYPSTNTSPLFQQTITLNQGESLDFVVGPGNNGQDPDAYDSTPIEITIVYEEPIVPVGAARLTVGDYHSCLLAETGSITCWGDNYWKQNNVPQGTYTQASAGQSFTCGLNSEGSVKCWGYNGGGQLNVPSGTFVQIDAGWNHACALTRGGRIECWGSNGSGESNVPANLQGTFRQVAAGERVTCGLTKSGEIKCWGYNSHGQTNAPADAFNRMSYLLAHGCAISTAGVLKCWGFNDYQQANAPSVPAGTFTQVSAGVHHSCAVNSSGQIQCWGGDNGGNTVSPEGLYTHVESGWKHNCAVASQGGVHCWGSNAHGQTNVPAELAAKPLPGITPSGSNVVVKAVDLASGQPSAAQINFNNVTTGGITTVQSRQMGSASSPSSPDTANFTLGDPPTYFDIETTATFSGSATVCIDYSGTSYGNESGLKLLHFNESTGQWEDITTSTNTESNTICGTTTSFSPFLVAETNVAPVVTSVTLPSRPLPVNTEVSVLATFTDSNSRDVHTASIDWDIGTSSAGIVDQSAKTVTAKRTFLEAGVHTVTVAVSDRGKVGTRSSAMEVTAYLVIYDPSAGFVTGGGWINSPERACRFDLCTDRTVGKASFGFVSRYKKGADIPDGNTEFQFQAGGLTFKSTSYQWLVVAGSRAQYKGTGTINGSGNYGFLLTAIDGQFNGGHGADRFRIKIWDKSNADRVVYDNQMDQAEDSNAATILGGGSIVIHNK